MLALGYAIGRIGCQVSGDGDYGIRSSLPWAMGYPHGAVPTPPGVTVQPTPIYETLAMGLVALRLWRLRDRYRPGVLFGSTSCWRGLERFLVEFVRRNDEVFLSLTAAAVGERRPSDRRARCGWSWRRAGAACGGSPPGRAVYGGNRDVCGVTCGAGRRSSSRTGADHESRRPGR